MPLRFVVDDNCPPKKRAGGAVAFAKKLTEDPSLGEHHEACPACKLLGGTGCYGVIDPPVSGTAEEWLVARLPESIESLGGLFLRKTLHDMHYEGEGGKALRKAGLLEASGDYTRHYGPFFRRYVVSSNQLIEQLFCVGDISPVHGLGLLVQLGGIEVDGRVLHSTDDATIYGELVEKPKTRSRTKCTMVVREDDDRSVGELKLLLRACWAAFVLDIDVKIVEDQ